MGQELTLTDVAYVGKARKILFRRLLDYVALPASEVTAQERSMGGDILLDMLFHASDEERKSAAERLAEMREAPRRVLRYLAQSDFDIAEPLLVENDAFDASDFLQILDQVSVQHRRAIAERKHVPIAVCDALAENAEVEVLQALLSNAAAKLSEMALDTLVLRSRKAPELCPLIIKRLELRPMQAMAMFWWADGPSRRLILQRQAAERNELIDMCGDLFAMAAEEGWRDQITRQTLQLIERRQRSRTAIERSPFDSLEDAISHGAKNGPTPELIEDIGYLSGIKPITIAKIVTDPGGESIAVLCKATGLNREYLEKFWLASDRQILLTGGLKNPDYDYVLETYELLTVAKAQTTLRYWNWSLSTAFTLSALENAEELEEDGSDESTFSAAKRTVRLVFGQS